MLSFERASRATQGARTYQEDSSLFWPSAEGDKDDQSVVAVNGSDYLVAVLADGMGGHTGGAIASKMACERFIAAYTEGNGDNRGRLVDALEAANVAIADTVAANPVLSGMGSTLVGVTFREDGVDWVSVGDSPLMLYRRGEIAPLNADHSLAPELDRLAAAGKITEDEAKKDPRRHMLRSAVTGDEIELIDYSKKPLKVEPGDYIILASDGLHTLEEAEVARIVAAYGSDGADAVASALVRAIDALRDPHQDNATIVAVRALAGEGAPAE